MEGGVSECWMYTAFRLADGDASDDVCLYVGISDSPSERMVQHSRDKWWWHLVERIEWCKFSCRQSAKQVESKAINVRKPLFNKQENDRTAAETLRSWLRLVSQQFHHCPLCLSHCQYSEVFWEAKSLTAIDDEEGKTAICFEVWITCNQNHAEVSWCQFIPVNVLCKCIPQAPDDVISALVNEANDDGDIVDDIPDLRPKTLAEMFETPRPCLNSLAVKEATDGTQSR